MQVCNDDLLAAAKELIPAAASHPFDVIRQIQLKNQAPHKRHHRFVHVDGVPVHLTFTLSSMGTRKFWQLSFKDDRHIALDQTIVNKIVHAFFGEGNFTEIPSILWQGTVRQFAQFIESDQQSEPVRVKVR